ncbi:MAG: hypothetical protein LBL18_00835, partial [Bacteroidales bacterium]|jgi:hypothetical protein|nr:hypothetical protein [Bacteroidales bacterium]
VIWSNIRGDIFFSCIGSEAAGTTAQTVNDNTVKSRIAMQITNEGIVKAREVLVTLSNWPDYVFAPDYELPSLSETESYIRDNGHLPEMPSAAEVEADGVKVGEMNALLLKKVEELTLYVIELQKQINELEKRGGE